VQYRIIQAFDWPSNVSGWQAMAKRRHSLLSLLRNV